MNQSELLELIEKQPEGTYLIMTVRDTTRQISTNTILRKEGDDWKAVYTPTVDDVYSNNQVANGLVLKLHNWSFS